MVFKNWYADMKTKETNTPEYNALYYKTNKESIKARRKRQRAEPEVKEKNAKYLKEYKARKRAEKLQAEKKANA